MKEKQLNAFISITALIAAIVMTAALSMAIGKWSWSSRLYELKILFPDATGISANTEVKYAGALVGRVRSVDFIPRSSQTMDPVSKAYNCVVVVIDLSRNVEIGEDSSALIRQDGLGITAKYILLTPGPNHNSNLLASGSTIQGTVPYAITDLIQPAGEALAQAKLLINDLQPMIHALPPIVARLDKLTSEISTDLPPVLGHTDKFLVDGDKALLALSEFNSPEARAKFNELLRNLSVSTENLKVVSSNAKALTATLAEKPWRLLWGGPTVAAPSEGAVLKSDHVIQLKPIIDVGPASASKK